MRYIQSELEKTLKKDHKMGFITGPRQVGKTTLAKNLLLSNEKHNYFNWDVDTMRRKILKNPVDFWRESSPSRITLDEIHKYPRWKRFLKSLYDACKEEVEILVTGSGRLDVYQKGGDSLFGRYHLFHLFPYSLGEMIKKNKPPLAPQECIENILSTNKNASQDLYNTLFTFNGFPEPLFKGDLKTLVQWQNDHRQLIIREDLRDLTHIREVGLIESMIYLLPERVGSPLSVNSLKTELNVNFNTVQNWLVTLDRLFFLFAIRPYAGKLARTLRREEKIYFYDWSELENIGKRFENLVAVHLWKACHYWTDAGYGHFQLYYVRDREKREVDFLITNRQKPFVLVECKQSDKNMDKSLLYFHERLKPQYSFQIIHEAEPSFSIQPTRESIYLCSASRFLTEF